MSSADLDHAFTRARAAAAGLPEVEEGTWYGTPALKVNAKSLMRVKDPETLVFRCSVEEKEMLIAAAPGVYYETDHYKGWPAVLVRLSADDAELRCCLRRAWLLVAPKRLVAALDAEAGKQRGEPAEKARRRSGRNRAD